MTTLPKQMRSLAGISDILDSGGRSITHARAVFISEVTGDECTAEHAKDVEGADP